MDWLKDLLKDKVPEEALEETLQSINKEFPKHAIPKNVFNEKNEELNTTKKQLEEQKTLMEVLKQKANSVEEYEQKINDWSTKYNELEKNAQDQIANITKKTQFNELLINKVPDSARDLLVDRYMDKVQIDDGKIKDPDILLESMKKERPELFLELREETDEKPKNQKQTTKASDAELDKLRKFAGLY